MYLVSLHGQETSFWPGSSGMPTECSAGTKAASVSSILRSTLVPMRAMTLHRDDDVGGVGDLDAEHRLLGLEVAHHEGDDVHRAAPHAPPVEVGHDRLHLLRVHPVVGGPRVLLVDRADVGAVLDARDVGRVGLGEERVGLLLRVEPGEGAALDERGGQLTPTRRRRRCTSGSGRAGSARRPRGPRTGCPRGSSGSWCSGWSWCRSSCQPGPLAHLVRRERRTATERVGGVVGGDESVIAAPLQRLVVPGSHRPAGAVPPVQVNVLTRSAARPLDRSKV